MLQDKAALQQNLGGSDGRPCTLTRPMQTPPPPPLPWCSTTTTRSAMILPSPLLTLPSGPTAAAGPAAAAPLLTLSTARPAVPKLLAVSWCSWTDAATTPGLSGRFAAAPTADAVPDTAAVVAAVAAAAALDTARGSSMLVPTVLPALWVLLTS
jgi:hypothetical protein